MPWRARSSRPAVSESMCPASSWSRMRIASGWSSMPSSRASATAAATALLEVSAVVATPTFYLVGSALASHGAMAVRSRLGGGADGQSRSSQREGALGLNAQNPSSPRPRMAPGFKQAALRDLRDRGHRTEHHSPNNPSRPGMGSSFYAAGCNVAWRAHPTSDNDVGSGRAAARCVHNPCPRQTSHIKQVPPYVR